MAVFQIKSLFFGLGILLIASTGKAQDIDPRPYLALPMQAHQEAAVFVKAVEHAFVNAVVTVSPRILKTQNKLLLEDPLFWQIFVFFKQIDTKHHKTSGHMRCVRIGRDTFDAIRAYKPSYIVATTARDEALVYPEELSDWPQNALAQVFCTKSLNNKKGEPAPIDTAAAKNWISTRLKMIDAPKKPFRNTDLIANGAWMQGRVVLIHVTLWQDTQSSHILNMRSYVLAP